VNEPGAGDYRSLAEAGWAWVQAQVRDDDGPWIPVSVIPGEDPQPGSDRDGLHSGIGGLAYVLAEIRLARPWSEQERALAGAVADRLRREIDRTQDCTFFDGLPSTIGALTALSEPGADRAVARLASLATGDGWPQAWVGPPRFVDGVRAHDLTLGTAGVLLAAIWARRHGVDGATQVAEQAADLLVRDGEQTPTGSNWLMAPRRYWADPVREMPNLSHGLAGIAAALAVAGAELGRSDLVEIARSGAEHLVTLAELGGDGFVVPLRIPPAPDREEVTYTWCHGPTGTSLLFPALERAGVEKLAGAGPRSWQRRCLTSVRGSGLPARLRPGFWDNDGQCCGTAGVGSVFLDAWQRGRDDADRQFAVQLGDALIERAVHDGPHAYWRFVEHRAVEPLLPPGVGWMQGAAGICAFLFRLDRLLDEGPDAEVVARMDTWWALPTADQGQREPDQPAACPVAAAPLRGTGHPYR